MDGRQGLGKVVHHRCGYGLWVQARYQGAFDSDAGTASPAGWGDVLVEYRDPSSGHVLFVCPGCDGVLRLWWPSGGRRVVTVSRAVQAFLWCVCE